MELRGAVALVTGASRGVGRASRSPRPARTSGAPATDSNPLKLPGTIDATAREVEARGRRALIAARPATDNARRAIVASVGSGRY
ncbi:MAG: hypothetical protein E6J59_00600 [Deltaproteobacteria bacterium]|nr:MAG: hypothetical protein E6J59_00600 [Deltaproteobacteria bacterium]